MVCFLFSHRRRNIPVGELKLIQDPKGRIRTELVAEPKGAWPEVTGLRFLTTTGELSVGLGMFENEGTLAFKDVTGILRLGLRIEDGNPRLVFWGPRNPSDTNSGGFRQIQLGLRKDGAHSLEFMNKAGKCRLSLGVTKDGDPFISMLDDKGTEIWKAA